MVVGYAIKVIKNLNIISGSNVYVSQEMSLLTLITGALLPDFNKVTAINLVIIYKLTKPIIYKPILII